MKKQKRSYPPQHQKRLDRLAIALKEMRFSEGRMDMLMKELPAGRFNVQNTGIT